MSASFLRKARRRPPREANPALRIGGFTALSWTDYPGLLSAVVYCQGCPWRCRYCHNPHLLAPRALKPLAWRDVERFLERRRGLLDAVVFSGGEPTLQSGIAEAMQAAKSMGFRIGLHTAGIYPRRLQNLLPLTDWIGMDIKAPFAHYAATTGKPNGASPVIESMQLIMQSGVSHEFRTTVHPALLLPQALLELAQLLAKLGVRNYAVQEFRGQGVTASPLPDARSYLTDTFCQSLAALFPSFTVRHA